MNYDFNTKQSLLSPLPLFLETLMTILPFSSKTTFGPNKYCPKVTKLTLPMFHFCHTLFFMGSSVCWCLCFLYDWLSVSLYSFVCNALCSYPHFIIIDIIIPDSLTMKAVNGVWHDSKQIIKLTWYLAEDFDRFVHGFVCFHDSPLKFLSVDIHQRVM